MHVHLRVQDGLCWNANESADAPTCGRVVVRQTDDWRPRIASGDGGVRDTVDRIMVLERQAGYFRVRCGCVGRCP